MNDQKGSHFCYVFKFHVKYDCANGNLSQNGIKKKYHTSGGEKSYKLKLAHSLQARVSLLDFSPPEVYKSHILKRTINKLLVRR